MRLIRDRKKGEGGMKVGGEGDYIPIATQSPPECFCTKVGSDESHFNVS